MRRRKRLWFLEPRDSHTWRKIADVIDPNTSFSEEMYQTRDGRPVNVFECSESQRDFIIESQNDLNFIVLTCLEGEHVLRYPDKKIHPAVQKVHYQLKHLRLMRSF